MKHLLIFFIPTFHLCLFVTSCEKKDKMLYGWRTSSGWEWKTTGDKNDNPMYNGQVKREYIILGDYIREGQGDLTYPDGRRFVGKWKDDKKNGQGTLTYPDGDKFVGEYKDYHRHGQGTFTSYNGEKWVHIRIIEEMVMGHIPHPMELGTLGNGMVDNLGMGKYISKKEIS